MSLILAGVNPIDTGTLAREDVIDLAVMAANVGRIDRPERWVDELADRAIQAEADAGLAAIL